MAKRKTRQTENQITETELNPEGVVEICRAKRARGSGKTNGCTPVQKYF